MTDMELGKVQAVEGVTFEEALAELELIVNRLEREKLSLDESLALFERGQTLGSYCSRLLDQAELRIRRLIPSSEGFEEEPFCSGE